MYTEYLKHKESYCTRAQKSYQTALKKLGTFTKNPKEMDLSEILKFCDYLKTELPKTSTGDWHTTYAYNLTILKDYLKFYDNPNSKYVKIPKIKYNPYPPVTREEFDLITDYLETEPLNFANLQKLLIVRMLWDTGCRISELLNIKWRDIKNSELFIRNKKNSDGRWIFWSDYTHDILLNFIAQRKYYEGDMLFTTNEGPMSVRCAQRYLEVLGKKLGITYPLTPHCFRQGKAHDLFKNGADIKTVKEALGHKSLKSTERYLVLEKDELKSKLIRYLT